MASTDTPVTENNEPSTPARSESDRGTTLVEILVAVVLMGFAVSSILAGMRTAIVVSSFSEDQAKTEAVLGSAADRLAGWRHIPCPTPDGENSYLPPVQAAAGDADWPTSSVRILDISYWNVPEGAEPTTGSFQSNNSLSGDLCNPSSTLTTAATLQKITIEVTSPSGDYIRRMEVVKNNVVPKDVLTQGEET